MAADPVFRPTTEIDVSVNHRARSLAVEPCQTLAEVLRDRLGLTGTKVSCDVQVCGSCTVLIDSLPVSSCTFLAADAEGHEVETIEGLLDEATGQPSTLQQAFIDHGAFQCGFCTPGFLMTATALLRDEPQPDRERVIEALEGNICRCTGYEPIIDAVLTAAGRIS